MQMNGCRHLVPLYPYHATNYIPGTHHVLQHLFCRQTFGNCELRKTGSPVSPWSPSKSSAYEWSHAVHWVKSGFKNESCRSYLSQSKHCSLSGSRNSTDSTNEIPRVVRLLRFTKYKDLCIYLVTASFTFPATTNLLCNPHSRVSWYQTYWQN